MSPLVLALIVVFAPACAGTAPLETYAPIGPAPDGFDRVTAQARCLEHLTALIEINTTNGSDPAPEEGRPDGNELATARYFERVLAGVDGVETHVLESAPGRANFIARLRASAPTDAPVLVMGHMDVVGADPALWSTPPFEATLRDGYVYGRGAIDCKGPLAAELTAFQALAAGRDRLSRDVVLLATAAEEGGPNVGIGWVLEHHADLLGAPEFALNEGGRIRIDGDRIRSVNVQTTEKLAYNVRATATGPSGHGSVPLPDNGLAALARAVSRVHEWRPPARLNETTSRFFRMQAMVESDPELRDAMDALRAAAPGSSEFERAAERLSSSPPYNAVLRTGLSLTMVEGGLRSNVIPSTGTANFNVRVLPDGDVEHIVAEMNRVGAEPAVTFELVGAPRRSPPVSSTRTDLYQAMENAAESMVEDVVVIPFMSTGGTDGAALRAIGIPTYGILPIPLRIDDELRMHGDNERAPIAGLGWAAEFVYRVLAEVAG